MDSQRKLCQLQTEYREKQAEYETESASLGDTLSRKLETETAEKKLLAKELVISFGVSQFSSVSLIGTFRL